MKYTVSYKVDLRIDVNINADTLEEAMKKAKKGYTEIQDLNTADIIDVEPVNISDENGELLADF